MHNESNQNRWTWIMLTGLLALGLATGVGALGLTSLTQQSQMATGSQSIPGH